MLQERYRLVKLVGNGGKYQTFIAVDEGVFPPISCILQRLVVNGELSMTFSDKVTKLKSLNDHPQIPNLLDFFTDQKYNYLVYELIIGDTLNQFLAKQGTFNEIQIWQLLKTILPILQFIHDHDLIHGNFQPKNIIINNSIENLVLVNFAASLILPNREKTIVSDPEYSAPEQIEGKPVFSSDLYSLGIICIYLLTHVSPFDLFDINNKCIWQDYLTQPISEYLSQVLTKMIDININTRWNSTSDMIRNLGIKRWKYQQQKSYNYADVVTIKNDIDQQINTIRFSPDQKILVAGDDKNIKVWGVEIYKLLSNFVAHTQAITCLDFNDNGQILATGSDDKNIKIWQVETWELIHTLNTHTKAVKSVSFHPHKNILVSGSWDKTIKVWDIDQFQEVLSITGHKLQINAVVFSPNGNIIASGSSDRTVKLWRIWQGEKSTHYHYQLLRTLVNHTWPVLTIAFSPDGTILASGSSDNTINLWDLNTGELITTLAGHSWSVVALAFIKDSQTLITGSWDTTVKIWNLQTNKEIITFNNHSDLITAIDVSADGNLIASSSKDKTIKIILNSFI
ncbi:protein kinase [Anabaena sp. FACHB-1237]|uniref:WD40 repeat domain-containing serine/threonine-protein kinase n=1 Tax=Anabaena sp. FACHB-1237 TaxID=2692769 RepID=UPI00167FF872|nr:WD40 repeat domain-containing serine/threonine-protein kinase [Anabaena sp. FACHB-1237]MBD2137710.1 protein kinase [Anabaena sp. FACHB-1237]